MAPLSLKIVLDEGAVTRTFKFESTTTVSEAQALVKEKILTGDDGKVYGLFLTSADDERSGIWLEGHRQLDYYMLRDGDQLFYLCRMRNLRVRLLDGSVRTLQVDESKTVEELMVDICARIGITNHDEYGLCHDRGGLDEDRLPAGTGTLTLKRAQRKQRDAELDQLRLKIKTDDNVEWLEQKSTLRELGAGDAPLLLKRRLFYSDRNVDARDPVQLNLLYVQARDAILGGRHPVTEDQAVEFAAIQCQVQYGDFQEDKHKPGLIENLNEYLPEQYSGSWGIEKKILKEYRKHQGLSPIEAKYLYTKTARDMPTYGVTFFLVKEKQKGKKKLVPRLLGINAESVLRLDEVTKEILQVWPLTQVKTYHAGKSESFTLNFGDYSDKEYSVKTNDAHSIRDILQGYIDLIRRRMDAKWHADHAVNYAVGEDYVEASRGNIMEHIQHNNKAVVEETFVGPSKIISYEPGQQITQGTQIMTVQQMVITAKGSNHQNIVVGEVPMRKDMSIDFVRKLNRLNSNSVKVVTFLSEPSDSNIEQARIIVRTMEADMPSIIEGVQESATKKPNEDARKKLLEELQELCDAMKSLTDATSGNVNPEEGEEAAKRIADLSTQMFFSLDPRTIKRGELCRRSRNSFIQDDKVAASLRRASFLAAAQVACGAIETAKATLAQSYEGPILDASAVEEVERAAEDKMGKLNAAVALYLTAYADPKNVDYSAAVTSMNTINELLPELTKDAMMLSGVKDGMSRQELLDEIRALCDAAKKVCLITDPDDHEKIQAAANEYGRVSEKLLFTFRRSGKPNKPNEVIDMAKDVGRKTSQLVAKARELSAMANPEDGELDEAAARCADAAKDLLACATVTAPSIHEPHCQSALTAAAETLSSSAQHLALCWKPLVDHPERKHVGDDLRDMTIDLAKALDRLKGTFAGFNGTPGEGTDDEQIKKSHRLKFITTAGDAKNRVTAAEEELSKPNTGPPLNKTSAEELQRKLAQRIAQLNAALAALVAATSDRDRPDYATANLAVTTITELMPEIVKDGKALSATKDEKSSADMLLDLKALCDAARGICEASENGGVEALNNSASKFATTSGKLFYVFNPRANNDKEHEILDLSSAACEKASEMLSSVYQLAADVGGEAGADLDHSGSRVADSANALLTSAQLTAPCMEDPRCQAILISSADALSAAANQLAATWAPVVHDPRFRDLGHKLEGDRQQLEKELERLRNACQVSASGRHPEDQQPGVPDKHRLQFMTSASAAKAQVEAAEKELSKPVVAPKGSVSATELTRKLYAGAAQLSAAVAALVAATADREKPDYVAADNAMNTINQLLPQIVKDTKTVSSGEDEATRAAMLAELRALCAAARDVCGSAGAATNEDLNNAAAKFANASRKLVYVFNPRSDQNKEHEILDLSSSACEKASQLLTNVYEAAARAEGEAGSQLDIAGSRVADAANALLTTAQLTAPCIQDPRCQATLVSAADALASANGHLAAAWGPLAHDPQFQDLGRRIQKGREELDDELERLKKACHVPDSGNELKAVSRPAPAIPDQRHLKFVNSAVAADEILQQAERELNKPIVAPKSGQTPPQLPDELADRLAKLNAAIAALLQATADRDKPDYDTAEQSIRLINQLMPLVVKDTKALSASKDEKDRKAMLDDLKAMCAATRGICASVRDGNHENLNYNAVSFGSNSGKLFYVVSPSTNQTKEHQIIDLSSQACEKATMLLTEVYQLAADVGGEVGTELDGSGSKTADAAKALLATAQLTAPSIHEKQCQASMLSAANALSSSAKHLASVWAVPVQTTHAAKAAPLNQGWKDLDEAIEKLKAAVLDDATAMKSPTKRAPPPPPKRTISSNENRQSLAAGSSRDISQEFLDRMRCEESLNVSHALATSEVDAKNKRKTDDEKALQQEFASNLDAAAHKIRKAEDDVNKIYSAKDEVIPALSVDQTLVVQKQMEQKLALAGVAVSNLIASNHPDSIDLAVASKSTTTLSDLMPQIVQDAKLLRGSLNDEERKRFLADFVALFAATKNMLEAAKEDRKKLDPLAVEFGNKSAKLLYVVSTDVDPSQEKEVLERVRNINESASRLAELGAESASTLAAPQLHALCRAGGACAGAATTLAYTAKLVAPSIQNAECNEALTKASTDLSTHLQSYSSTWAPLEASPQSSSVKELRSGAESLEKLLEELRKDLGTGKLVKRRTVERVLVEDTPLRRLACVVQEEAKRRAESSNTLPEQRSKYAKYANELGQAIKQLDLAYHRCRQSPHDSAKRQDLEYAVQNLQITLLQTRPSQDGRPQNNIVDLTEYVKEVAYDADQLKKQCKNGQPEVLPVLDTIKQHCEQITNQASLLTTTEHSDMTDEVGWMEIEQFAEECDNHLNGVNYLIEGLNDGKLKIDLQEKTTRLSEDCNMLRFATKCALASSQGVSLDATLDDLTDLESKIDEMLAQGEKSNNKPRWSSSGRGRVVAAASRACAGVSRALPPAFTAYVDDVRGGTDLSDHLDRTQSKEHLRKVLSLLKALTMTTSRHVATWQKLGHPETAEITGQILQELDSHQNHLNTTKGMVQSSVLSDVDVNKLLFPTDVKVHGDHKQISDKLQQEASKLSTTASTIMQSGHEPAALARSLRAAADAAVGVAAHAKALRTNDLAQSQKIDEATKEMSLQTYNVLKTADMVSQQPNNIASRRRLLDACRLLNDAINQLVRTTSPSSKLSRECVELTRSLQLAQALQAPQPAAGRYADCVEALHNQRDVIQKLSNDEPMSRAEFRRALGYVSSAVCNSTEYAAQCAYLLLIADQNKEMAIEGFMDTSRVTSLSEAVQDTCHRIIRTDVEQAKAEEVVLNKQIQDLQQAVSEARDGTRDKGVKAELNACAADIHAAANSLHAVVNERKPERARLTTFTLRLLDAVRAAAGAAERASLAPELKDISPEAKARSDDVLNNSRALNNNMISLIREVKASEDLDPMTWVTFGTSRKAVLDMFEALINSIKENGKRAGVLEPSQSDLEEDADVPKRSYVQIQLDLANKWLRRPSAKADVKSAGEEAARNIIKLGEQMAEDLKGNDNEEMLQLTQESKALLADCLKKYDNEKASALTERLKELRRSIERGVVLRVVEHFLEGEEPLADLELLAETEKDETKRKFLLERKIAELLAHLGRVTKTARIVAGAGNGGPQVTEDLIKCSDQTELLAPMLVKAAQQRVASPDDKAAIEHYQKLLAQYAESLANVRNLCDQAVDPMDFVQTAGETMQRMREDTHDNDPQKCAYASTAITKLANRVINVSLSSNDVRKDPELQKLLKEAREKLKATVPPPNARPSRIPDWKVTTAEILRTTGEVESVLGGETIFNKQQGSDQPIFAAARDLHAAVREWSARDNAIVAVARRMAVLMARLSDYMNTDRKRELLATSKSIVAESHEVAELATKLAHECTDVRIKTNLLQVCERIPTISGQLKMLATVKGSSLGHQGLKEDQEDMIMLVGNAQNLMLSVQEVVKVAASASVKIASQRGGPRMRWVRKNYY